MYKRRIQKTIINLKPPIPMVIMLFMLLFHCGINSGLLAQNRTIEFSGYEWTVKAGRHPMGPGPNYFSQNSQNVRVDSEGRLHLSIREHNGRWLCSEVYTSNNFGYGWYFLETKSPLYRFDAQTVVGFFTWDETKPPYYQELDIEFSQWGGNSGHDKIGQFVVQPAVHPENIFRFDYCSGDFQDHPGSLTGCDTKKNIETASDVSRELMFDSSTHVILWQPDAVYFASFYCFPGYHEIKNSFQPANEKLFIHDQLMASWVFSPDDSTWNPVAPSESTEVRLNFWLYQGQPPVSGEIHNLVIESFQFYPQEK